MKIKNLASLVLATGLAGCSSMPVVGDNIHRVAPGVYRSAQLDIKDDLKEFIKDKKIDHYITLRGPNRLTSKEKEVCESYGVKYHVFTFSARYPPNREELIRLANLFSELNNSGERFAFHCNFGSDRSGMAEAVYHMIKGKSVDDSIERSFRLRQGYLGIGLTQAPLDFIESYKPYENKISFKEWLYRNYQNEIVSK